MKKISELMSLKGRVAIVTGGTGHIGRTFCEALAEAGAQVVVLDLSAPECEAVADDLQKKFGIKALPLAIDLASEAMVRAVPDEVQKKFDRINVLVNCAAYVGSSDLKGWAVPFSEQSSDAWRQALEVNLTAAFVLTQACGSALRNSGKGSVINIGSIYGLIGPDMRLYEGTTMGNPAAYAVSKGGVLQLTRWLATVLAPEVRVNAISPGGVWRNQPKAFVQHYKSRIPLQRMAVEDDLKGVAVFLASDLSAYMTGQNLIIDGGYTAW
jgi:NAD(P)-dependent dehydrogenase (short-subunit alcohol dehydrogenase family)